MTSFGASRASIIEKQYQLDASQQARRALADQRRIAEERRVTQDRIETIDHALKTLRADNAEEKKSIDALNDERAKAVEKLLSIDKKEEAERERNRLKDKEIEEKRKRDQAAASPTGALLGGLQTGQLKTLENGLKSFGDVAQVVMSAVGASIKGVSDGLGQLVENWVLTGETGAHAMRKLVAQTLASVASQAAVLAIMSLAYAALATTVVGSILLGGTPAQFLEAAALFGAVAVVAGLAGRAVAGNLFKQNGTSGTGGAGGGSIGGSGSAPTAGSQTTAPTIVQGRNQVASSPIVIHLRSNDSHIVRVVSQNVNDNGVLRELVVKTVGE
jgi:hypothetical protein